MTQNRKNPKKEKRLLELSHPIEIPNFKNLKNCLTFSLYYFDGSQTAGQNIRDWTEKEKEDLFNKLKDYSQNTKTHWLNERCGGGGLKILAIYGHFPVNTDFRCPKNIPDNVIWARFRMDNKIRLAGFFINNEDAKENHLSPNTFYIVFLDKNHRFYVTEKK